MNHAFSLIFSGVLAVGVSACSAAPPKAEADSSADRTPPAGSCNDASLDWTLGQVADDALVDKARKEAGADTVRVLRPGMMVTREYNGARLNLRVDNERKVLAHSCG